MFKIREWIDDIRYGSNLVRIGAGAGALLVAVLLYFLVQVVTGGGTTPVGQGGTSRPTGVVVHPQTTPTTGGLQTTSTAKPTTTNRPGNLPTAKPVAGATYNTFFKLLSSGESAAKATAAVAAIDARTLGSLKDPFKSVASKIRSNTSTVLIANAKAGANKKTLWSTNPSLAITNLVGAIKSGAGTSIGNMTVSSVGRNGSFKLAELTKGNILLDRPLTLSYKLGTLSCRVDLEIFVPTFLENGSCN